MVFILLDVKAGLSVDRMSLQRWPTPHTKMIEKNVEAQVCLM
jgi:hypothetical protein